MSSEHKVKKQKNKWLKFLFILLKIILVPALLVISIYIGLWIGYVKLGNQPSSEIFQIETWKHLINFILN